MCSTRRRARTAGGMITATGDRTRHSVTFLSLTSRLNCAMRARRMQSSMTSQERGRGPCPLPNPHPYPPMSHMPPNRRQRV